MFIDMHFQLYFLLWLFVAKGSEKVHIYEENKG